WRRVRQQLPSRRLPSVAEAVREQLARPEVDATIRPGLRVAIGVGSRGIGCLQEVVAALVAELRQRGAEPFIVPAMGSHGGGTALGQRGVLEAYGITEEAFGAPVRASMEVDQLGTVLDGVPVYLDRIAHREADLVVPVGRVKPHTSFRYDLESGLHKMLAIGLAKHRGASNVHTYPWERFGELIEASGQFVLAHASVPFGVAIVEDAYEAPAIIEAVPAADFLARERELLALAKAWLPRLPFPAADVLVVQELGKDISGSGMDPNVTGRFQMASMPKPVQLQWIAVLDLTVATHGNATGLGFADVTTRRVLEKLDVVATYTNHVTSQSLIGAKLPLVAETDQEAIAIAASALRRTPPERARIAWVKNTLELLDLRVSEPLWAEMAAQEDVVATGEPEPIRFDAAGTLTV
ncbi:MAG: lactate racemase domain-containing protein, partial [Candidatus Dormiibacterota bacterium]